MSYDPAYTVIKKLGTFSSVAAQLRIGRQAVWKWTRPKGPNGGTGGIIPQRHHRALLDAARAADVPLTAADFLPKNTEGDA